jgi:hypothetical protein
MKTLLYATALTLAFIASVPAAQAAGVLRNATVTHLVSSGAHPNSAHALTSTYYFTLHVAGKPLSQLSIDVPEDIKSTQGIEVQDSSGQILDTKLSWKNQMATITFAQPVSPENTLKVSLKEVQTSGFAKSHSTIWLLPVSGQSVGLNAEIPFGLVRIHTYVN